MRFLRYSPLLALALGAALIGCGGESNDDGSIDSGLTAGVSSTSGGSIDNGNTGSTGTTVPAAAPGKITTVDLTPREVTGTASSSRITDFAVASSVSVAGSYTTINLTQTNLGDRYNRTLSLTLPSDLTVGRQFEFNTTTVTTPATAIYSEIATFGDTQARYSATTTGTVTVTSRTGNDVTLQVSGVFFEPVSNDGAASGTFLLSGPIRFTLPN